MNSLWLFFLMVVVTVLLAGLAFLLLPGRHRKRRTGKAHYSDKELLKKRSGVARKPDHGARIARQHGHERSPEWPRVAKEHLLHEPACVACGHKGEGLQVHHIKPFHLHPQLELDPRNLITLCEVKGRDHHLLLGHLDEWESYNEHIRDHVRQFYGKTAAQIRADSGWQKMVNLRPWPHRPKATS